jgi:hypothetical protein
MKILDLLNRRTKWTQFTRARNKQGDRVPPCDPKAVCWCLIGAAEKCYPTPVERQKVFDRISEALNGKALFISHFNDHSLTTFAHIRRILRKANV